MDDKEFERFAETYGANLGRWPQAVREQAQLHAQQSTYAQQALQKSAALDHLLGSQGTVAIDETLRANILNMPSQLRDTYIVWALKPFRPAMTLAACAVIGLLAGAMNLAPLPTSGQGAATLFLGTDDVTGAGL